MHHPQYMLAAAEAITLAGSTHGPDGPPCDKRLFDKAKAVFTEQIKIPIYEPGPHDLSKLTDAIMAFMEVKKIMAAEAQDAANFRLEMMAQCVFCSAKKAALTHAPQVHRLAKASAHPHCV